MNTARPDRRQFLAAIGTIAVAGVTIPVLAGCGSGSEAPTASFPEVDDATKQAIGAAINAGEVPVGGAKFFTDAGLIVTQPTEGQYVALTDICPHEQGKVTRLTNGQLVCPLHGSQFDPATGAVTAGPSLAGLSTKSVSVSGSSATLT